MAKACGPMPKGMASAKGKGKASASKKGGTKSAFKAKSTKVPAQAPMPFGGATGPGQGTFNKFK